MSLIVGLMQEFVSKLYVMIGQPYLYYCFHSLSDHIQTDCNNCGVGDSGDKSGGDGHCGLLMLDGNLGRENWRAPLRECPVDLQCDLVSNSRLGCM